MGSWLQDELEQHLAWNECWRFRGLKGEPARFRDLKESRDGYVSRNTPDGSWTLTVFPGSRRIALSNQSLEFSHTRCSARRRSHLDVVWQYQCRIGMLETQLHCPWLLLVLRRITSLAFEVGCRFYSRWIPLERSLWDADSTPRAFAFRLCYISLPRCRQGPTEERTFTTMSPKKHSPRAVGERTRVSLEYAAAQAQTGLSSSPSCRRHVAVSWALCEEHKKPSAHSQRCPRPRSHGRTVASTHELGRRAHQLWWHDQQTEVCARWKRRHGGAPLRTATLARTSGGA